MTARIERKLQQVGAGVHAYTQLPGSWGFSNAGLVTDRGAALLVDTLFDCRLTNEMLAAMRHVMPPGTRIGTVVNTHGNGDHCYGNSAVEGAEIIGTRGCAVDLAEAPPSRNAALMRAARLILALGPAGRLLGRCGGALGIHMVAWLAEAAPMAVPLFSPFDFTRNEPVLPSRIVEGRLDLRVGDKRIDVIEVGPAHTRGDAVVYVPDDRVVFTGDILFQDAHPVVWQGPVANWIRACRTLLDLDLETVVPGHGPVTDRSGIEGMLAYLELLTAEARRRYDAGLPAEEAARDIALDAYRGWLDGERVYVNVRTLYRDFSGDTRQPHPLELFAGMARLRRAVR